MSNQEKTELYAELEQRLLTVIKNNEAIRRELNEVFSSTERAKREIESYYRMRRLRRLAARHAV